LQAARGRCPPQEVGLQTEDIRVRVADAGVHDAGLYLSQREAGYAYSSAGGRGGLCVRQSAAVTIRTILPGAPLVHRQAQDVQTTM
jgi:hypothetical protein